MIENHVTMKHIAEAYQEFAEAIGIKSFLELCKQYGGTSVYIPKLDTMIRPARDELICKEYNRVNCRELAHKYGLSQTQIRKIVSEHHSSY